MYDENPHTRPVPEEPIRRRTIMIKTDGTVLRTRDGADVFATTNDLPEENVLV